MPTSWLDLLCWTLSSAGSPLCTGVRSQLPCPWFHANCLSAPFSNQLSFVSPYHFRIRRDFRSKNPLSGFAPKQTKESSAWRATYIVLQAGSFQFSEHHTKRKPNQNRKRIEKTFLHSVPSYLHDYIYIRTLVSLRKFHETESNGKNQFVYDIFD